MSISSDVIERLPHVEGLLNYLAPMAEKPMNLTYDPPPGVPRSTGVPEPHVMLIHDARPVAGRLTLDGEGLAHIERRSAVKDFYDEDELRRVYYPEAIRLVAEATGASRVLVFDRVRRACGGSSIWGRTPRPACVLRQKRGLPPPTFATSMNRASARSSFPPALRRPR